MSVSERRELLLRDWRYATIVRAEEASLNGELLSVNSESYVFIIYKQKQQERTANLRVEVVADIRSYYRQYTTQCEVNQTPFAGTEHLNNNAASYIACIVKFAIA
jgi:hypothetical protein